MRFAWAVLFFVVATIFAVAGWLEIGHPAGKALAVLFAFLGVTDVIVKWGSTD